jgi:hypothetical protein
MAGFGDVYSFIKMIVSAEICIKRYDFSQIQLAHDGSVGVERRMSDTV